MVRCCGFGLPTHCVLWFSIYHATVSAHRCLWQNAVFVCPKSAHVLAGGKTHPHAPPRMVLSHWWSASASLPQALGILPVIPEAAVHCTDTNAKASGKTSLAAAGPAPSSSSAKQRSSCRQEADHKRCFWSFSAAVLLGAYQLKGRQICSGKSLLN